MIADSAAWLEQALADGRIAAIDRAFARFLRELDPAVDPRVQIAAALLSHELGEGHICMPLETFREREPDLGDPIAFLSGSRVVADPSGDPAAPLVIEHGMLYMRRFWRDEARVAQAIQERMGVREADAGLGAELARLFPADALRPDWQKIACALAARSGFAVITGGPGTGKTTTVVRLLGLLQTLALRDGGSRLRIRLAAPTGKAAARLNASIAGQVAQLQVDPSVKQSHPRGGDHAASFARHTPGLARLPAQRRESAPSRCASDRRGVDDRSRNDGRDARCAAAQCAPRVAGRQGPAVVGGGGRRAWRSLRARRRRSLRSIHARLGARGLRRGRHALDECR